MAEEVKKAEEAKTEAPKSKKPVNSTEILKKCYGILGFKVDGAPRVRGMNVRDLREVGQEIVELAEDERTKSFGEVIAKALGIPDVVGAAEQIVAHLERK